MSESEKFVRRRDIGIYKPNKKVTGAVAQFKMANDNSCMFLELAKQTADMDSAKPYDWENTKITVKLGVPDITKMLAYFNLRQLPSEPLKLFHKNDRGSKSIELSWQENYRTYLLKVSSKEGNDAPKQVMIPIGLDEVEYLKVGFNRGLELILNW